MLVGAKAGLADRLASTAVEVAELKAPTLAKMIEGQRIEVERALPDHLKRSVDAFLRAAQTLVKQTPGLIKADPLTVLGGMMTAASLGLEFGPLGHCYLVPFKNHGKDEAQFQLGYKGKIDLSWRSGKLLSIAAREVRRNDYFEYEYGLDEKLEHRPLKEGDRGDAFMWYGVAKFKDGGHHFVVLNREDVNRHRKYSKSATSEFSPWNTSFSAMAMKSCIHEMTPFLPLTTEVMRDLALDGIVARGTSADDLEVEQVDIEPDDIEDAVVVGEGADTETGELFRSDEQL